MTEKQTRMLIFDLWIDRGPDCRVLIDSGGIVAASESHCRKGWFGRLEPVVEIELDDGMYVVRDPDRTVLTFINSIKGVA